MPTIRTSEFTVLQIVGLDAAVVSLIMNCDNFFSATLLYTASQLLQNGVLSILCVLFFCGNDSYASELDSMQLGIYGGLF
jgi:hypothetical protein